MQTFTVDPRCWWIGRLFCRNPLVRLSDRLEVLAILAALAVSFAGIAVAGAVGTEIHDAERRADTALSQTRHPVSATVVEYGGVTTLDGSRMPVVRAHWVAGGAVHTDVFRWGKKAIPGDRIQIWVDNRGNHLNGVTPLRPALDALTVAASIVLLALIVPALALELLRWRLRRARDGYWDREIRSLATSP